MARRSSCCFPCEIAWRRELGTDAWSEDSRWNAIFNDPFRDRTWQILCKFPPPRCRATFSTCWGDWIAQKTWRKRKIALEKVQKTSGDISSKLQISFACRSRTCPDPRWWFLCYIGVFLLHFMGREQHGDNSAERNLSNGQLWSYSEINCFFQQENAWLRNYRVRNQHPNLPENFTSMGFCAFLRFRTSDSRSDFPLG